MKQTRAIMGMPVTLEIVDKAGADVFDEVFSYFEYVDEKFSPYEEGSELFLINAGRIPEGDWSGDMRLIFELAEKTKRETDGYFDIRNREGFLDPSGLVKGWAIRNAAQIIKREGFENFYVEAGGDIEASGRNAKGERWTVGIKNPFAQNKIVKKLSIEDGGIATSGTYIRGAHIWNPRSKSDPLSDIVSLTVIGPDVYEADRFATGAFAMGKEGIGLIERAAGLEGYAIDRNGIATMTSAFGQYVNVG